jgi:hypothetical protein
MRKQYVETSETKAWFGSILPTRIPRQKVRVRLGGGGSGETERRGDKGPEGAARMASGAEMLGVAMGTAGGGDGEPKRV